MKISKINFAVLFVSLLLLLSFTLAQGHYVSTLEDVRASDNTDEDVRDILSLHGFAFDPCSKDLNPSLLAKYKALFISKF